MSAKTIWESVRAESDDLVEKLKQLIHEGNVRRIVVEHGGRTIAEFPVTAGVVGAVLAPVLAAVGAIAALLKDCTIRVERVETPAANPGPSPAHPAGAAADPVDRTA